MVKIKYNMLLFSWKKIYKAANGRTSECLRIIRMLTYKRLPKSKQDPLFKYIDKNFSGMSFLINPEALFANANAYAYSQKEILTYIFLASLRNLSDYLVTKKTSLDLFHVVINSELYNNNRLLRIEDNEICFLYEEVN